MYIVRDERERRGRYVHCEKRPKNVGRGPAYKSISVRPITALNCQINARLGAGERAFGAGRAGSPGRAVITFGARRADVGDGRRDCGAGGRTSVRPSVRPSSSLPPPALSAARVSFVRPARPIPSFRRRPSGDTCARTRACVPYRIAWR